MPELRLNIQGFDCSSNINKYSLQMDIVLYVKVYSTRCHHSDRELAVMNGFRYGIPNGIKPKPTNKVPYPICLIIVVVFHDPMYNLWVFRPPLTLHMMRYFAPSLFRPTVILIDHTINILLQYLGLSFIY